MAADKKKIQEIADLLDKIQKNYNKLGEKNPFRGIDPNTVKNVDQEILRLQDSLQGVQDRVDNLDMSFTDLTDTLKEIVKEINPRMFNATKEMQKGMKGLVNEASKLADEEADISLLSEKQLKTMLERAKKSKQMAQDNAAEILKKAKLMDSEGNLLDSFLIKQRSLTEEQKSALKIVKDEGQFQQAVIDGIEKRIKLEEEFNKRLGFGGQLAKGLDNALQKAGFPALGISDAIEKTRKNFIEAKKEGKAFSVTLGVAKELALNLKEALSFTNLMQLGLTTMVASLVEADKSSGEFAKNQGISYKQTLAIRDDMNAIAMASKDIMVNSKELMKTQESLNKFFGSSVKFSGQLAADMTSIARRTGMSEESQGLFALESIKTGKSAKDLLKTQTAQVFELNKQKGLQVSVKEIQEAIGKTSKALQLTFKGSTKELTNQVMQAKALGATMSQVEQISSSLLDFESSIASELEAELLLGKEINLEKAREAALRGDSGKVAEEVMKNTAIMNAFETKNVIAQEAAAKALGMNRDQLAEMVMEQQKLETLRKAGFSDMNDAQTQYNEMRERGLSAEAAAKELGDADLARQLESVSQAERLAATMERVQEVFIQMAEPLLGLVEGILKMVGGAENLAGILAGIAAIYLTIKTVQQATIALDSIRVAKETTLAGIAGAKAIAEVTAASAATLGLAVVAILAGVASVASFMKSSQSSAKNVQDAMIGPDGGLMVSGPKGTFQLDKEDSVIAGTDLNKDGGGGGNSALISEVRTLIGINRQILAKSSVIEMNGNKVGEGVSQAERAIQ